MYAQRNWKSRSGAILTVETQQVSLNENSVLDYIAGKSGVQHLLKRCLKSATDCMVLHSSRHKKLAWIICAK